MRVGCVLFELVPLAWLAAAAAVGCLVTGDEGGGDGVLAGGDGGTVVCATGAVFAQAKPHFVVVFRHKTQVRPGEQALLLGHVF